MSTPPDTVDDDEPLHRVVNERAGQVKDGKVHYMAFWTRSDPYHISVDRGRYRSTDQSLAERPDGCELAQLLTGKVRALDLEPPLEVQADPEEGNPAHANIVVDASTSKRAIKNKICCRLADIAQLVDAPEAG